MNKTVWDISYELESIAERYFENKFDHSGTIFDRAVIEQDMFYDVMHLLLHMYGKDGSYEFFDKYYETKRVNMNQIAHYQEMFEEFKSLLIKQSEEKIK